MRLWVSSVVLGLLAATGCGKAASPTPAAPTRATNPSSADTTPSAPAAATTAVSTAPIAAASAGGPCEANEIAMSFGGRNGDFTGMSHDGAILILKNIGKRDCTVPKRPQLTFTDTSGNAVNLTVNVPVGMHPGPAMIPVLLKPGAAASGKMRWVTGPVYEQSVCVKPAHASLDLKGHAVTQDFAAMVCGQSGATPHYEQEWLQPGETGGSTDAAR